MAHMRLNRNINNNQKFLKEEKDNIGNNRIDRKKSDFRILKALTLVTQLGLIIGISTAAGVFLGGWIDMKLDTKGILVIVCAVLGLAAGLLAGYRLIRKVLG